MRTIVWDVDDVLNDLTRSWFQQAWLPTHPETRLQFGDLSENPPDHLLDVPRDTYLSSLDAFRLSEMGRTLAPNPEVLAWFQHRGTKFRHVALTATPRSNAEHAATWVMKHFGDWIRVFGFVPSPRAGETTPVYDCDKSDFLNQFGLCDVFVDDNPHTVKKISQMGISCVLAPRPWNSEREPLLSALDAAIAGLPASRSSAFRKESSLR